MRLFLPFFVLLGCPPKEGGSETSGETANESGSETDSPCQYLLSGTEWEWNGACPQMRTPCDIVVTGCSLAIDYEADGGMTMGMPYAATISGTTVTFEDGDTITGCIGEAKDAEEIVGTCDGGCTFTLSWNDNG